MARRYRVDRWASRSPVVLVSRLVRKNVLADFVTCGTALQEKSGDIQHQIQTMASGGENLVGVASPEMAIGLMVAVKSTATPTGYSFSGNTCRFTTGTKCSNGSLMARIVSVSGDIDTKANTIDYTYTVEVFCGTALACVENGAFSGSRVPGSGKGFLGAWDGKRTWTIECCPTRHQLQKPK